MSWIGTGLGPYRQCDSTYGHFVAEALPALPERIFDGTFGWLVPDEVAPTGSSLPASGTAAADLCRPSRT